jgi:hypothetical protein
MCSVVAEYDTEGGPVEMVGIPHLWVVHTTASVSYFNLCFVLTPPVLQQIDVITALGWLHAPPCDARIMNWGNANKTVSSASLCHVLTGYSKM